MKKRNTNTSGEVRSTHQKYAPVIGPRCQREVIACPLAASTPMPAANEIQKAIATQRSLSRERIRNPPARITASASRSQPDIGPHQKSSGSARERPRMRKHRTRPKLEG